MAYWEMLSSEQARHHARITPISSNNGFLSDRLPAFGGHGRYCVCMQRILWLAILAVWCGSLLGGCATRVTPSADVHDPAVVYLVDYGRHSSLLIPSAAPPSPLQRSDLREYSYGDWMYYAKGQDSVWDGARALLWRSRGALGRRDLPGFGPALDEAPIEPAAMIQRRLGVERVYPIVVERERAEALLAMLDARFDQGKSRGPLVENTRVDLDFVQDEVDYSLARHCNHEVRDWLRELGVDAVFAPLIADFKVLPPQPAEN